MISLPPHLRALAARKGVDLIALAEVADAPTRVGWRLSDSEMAQWHRDTAEQRLAAAVPPLFRKADIRQAPTDVRKWLSAHLQDPKAYPWLLLAGETGVGKTHHGWAVIKAIIRQAATVGAHPIIQYVNQETFNDELRPKPDKSHAYAVKKYLDADLLFFDDIGAGKPTEFNAEGTLTVINHRYEQLLPTIYTSNLGKAAITDLLGARVYSRLAKTGRILIEGPDRRIGTGWQP